MIRSFIVAAASAAVLALSATAFAADHGTADEAKAMLMKTVAAIKADKAKTIDLINKGEGGFLDRDLYPFYSNISDGKNVALGNPNAKQLLGVDVRTTKDVNGKAFGQEFWDAYQKPEGEITEVSYMFVRPGPDKRRCRRLASSPGWAIWAVVSAITSRSFQTPVDFRFVPKAA